MAESDGDGRGTQGVVFGVFADRIIADYPPMGHLGCGFMEGNP